MGCRISGMVLIWVCLVLGGMSTAWPKLAASPPRSSALPTQDDILQPEVAAARKAAIQTQLDTLERSSIPQEERDKARVPLDEMLQRFNALEDAWKRHDMFRQTLASLPKRLEELAATQKVLDAHQAGQLPNATETLRDQYATQLYTIQTDIQDLLKQNSAGEARLAAIPQELEQRGAERPKLQERLAEARRQASNADQSSTLVTEVSRLEVQLQLLLAEVRALEAERQWLSQRGPLHDALLRVAQTKLTHVQQDLSSITNALGRTFEQEQATLNEKAAELEQALKTATEPVEALQLTVHLETVRMRQATADYRQQLNQLNNHVLAQDQLTVEQRQDSDRIAALFEKYASGENGGELLVIAFERLRREHQRFRDTSAKPIQTPLRTFTELLYKAEDRLYGYDRQVATRLEGLLPAGQTLPVWLRQAFDEQKGALRQQQQVLMAIVQKYTALMSLHREHRRLLDDSYYTALTKMFWLRDAERFNLTVVRQIMMGAGSSVTRFRDMIRAEHLLLGTVLTDAVHLWVLAVVLLLFVPWIAYKMYAYLRALVTSLLVRCAERGLSCGLLDALFMALRAAVWPAYLMLLAWSRAQFAPRDAVTTDWPLSGGLQVIAITLFVALLARDIFRSGGWGRQFWGWRPALCRFLYRIVWVGCLAAFVLMVPRSLLLAAPGQGEIATASLALARFLLLLFQSMIFVLVAILGWRQNPLMEGRLTRSQQEEGLLWRLWPFIYLIVLAGLVGIITLDILGYRYAARFVWLRSLESFSVLLLWRLLIVLLLVRILHRMVGYMVRLWPHSQREQSPSATPFDQVFHVAYKVGNTLLAIVAVSAILEIWGVSVSWFLMSPLGGDIMRRAVIIAITIGIMILVMQISKVVTEYLVQPRTTPQGGINQPNRKFRTMVPLIHTLVKFGVVFSAILVILQQLNVAIGPILTGVGIFGLAVGFASQSLIKDVINGLFILFEDSLSVGDIVKLRGVGGEVEKVTLRAVTIRDLEGNVHVIPNSTLDLITNMTKVFSRYVLDVGVAYREDIDTVIEILNEVSEGLQNDPNFGWDMMKPLEILGVDAFSDSAVIIRARLWALPGKQWRLGREFRRRLKKVFDERGIEIPFPHRTIYWGMPKESPQSPVHIALDPPSQRTDNGVSRQSERQASPIIED